MVPRQSSSRSIASAVALSLASSMGATSSIRRSAGARVSNSRDGWRPEDESSFSSEDNTARIAAKSAAPTPATRPAVPRKPYPRARARAGRWDRRRKASTSSPRCQSGEAAGAPSFWPQPWAPPRAARASAPAPPWARAARRNPRRTPRCRPPRHRCKRREERRTRSCAPSRWRASAESASGLERAQAPPLSSAAEPRASLSATGQPGSCPCRTPSRLQKSALLSR